MFCWYHKLTLLLMRCKTKNDVNVDVNVDLHLLFTNSSYTCRTLSENKILGQYFSFIYLRTLLIFVLVENLFYGYVTIIKDEFDHHISCSFENTKFHFYHPLLLLYNL